MKRCLTCLALALTATAFCDQLSAQVAETARVGVFGLFQPTELTIRPAAGSALRLEADGLAFDVGELEAVRLKLDRSAVKVTFRGHSFTVGGLSATSRRPSSGFSLAVPGKIERHFRGLLEIKPQSKSLQAAIAMDLETVVASVVAAESSSDAGLESLKAQAIATRSYLLAAGPRHDGYDFCDTTHCQFLKEPPGPGSRAVRAAQATRGLALHYRNQVVTALFSRSCGGTTLTLREAGFEERAYPYHRVACAKCGRDPERWQSHLSGDDASFLEGSSRSEPARIALGRRLGWNAVPGNSFEMRSRGDEAFLIGRGKGHGVGLCQRGAAAMAAEGSDFLTILRHYYPDTTVAALKKKPSRAF